MHIMFFPVLFSYRLYVKFYKRNLNWHNTGDEIIKDKNTISLQTFKIQFRFFLSFQTIMTK